MRIHSQLYISVYLRGMKVLSSLHPGFQGTSEKRRRSSAIGGGNPIKWRR